MKRMVIVAFLAIGICIGLAVLYKNNAASDPAHTKILYQGTTISIGELSIGLGSVDDAVAVLIIHEKGRTDSVIRSVSAGDNVLVYGYTLNVSSVKKSFNRLLVPGLSHGYVKFTIVGKSSTVGDY